MNTRVSSSRRLAVGLLGGFVLMVTPQVASAAPHVAPIASQPSGASYAEWGARWWQWAGETPTSSNPLAGADCSGGQDGHVWFLAGVLGTGGDERTCSVPTGTALFLPIINAAYFAFLNDPPATRTEEFVRTHAVCLADSVSATIDGTPVANAQSYYVSAQQSPLFDVQLPADNVFGLTEADAHQLLLSPSAHSGYYLFVRPLSPGTHTLEWQGSGACGEQDVSYTIQVVPRGQQ